MVFGYNLLSFSLMVVYVVNIAFGATFLPENEVQALKDIAKTMNQKDWNFSVDPCGWIRETEAFVARRENGVVCNCSFSDQKVCHVVSIVVVGLNLQGRLPPELVRLPFLRHFDVNRNFLTGSIPPEWGSMQLVTIVISGNPLTGSIPKELGNISTLVNFGAEFNRLSGNLPPELGNLSRLERLLITSNYFSGEIPRTYAKLTSLRDLWLSDNNFTGRMPDFIRDWGKLDRLVIQASGLTGPIPDAIASLENLTDLRITDLNGPEATFPQLKNMKKLKRLILRSCNIIGSLPVYLGEMKDLSNLDLSFNKLSGEIPGTYGNLSVANSIFLAGNSLDGQIPAWMITGQNIDLTYNNFTTGNASVSSCQHRNVNLFASSSKGNSSAVDSCLRICSETFYDLHINCGGRAVTINGKTTYEDDRDVVGPSSYVQHETNWAISSTGNFVDGSSMSDSYIYTVNATRLSMNDSQLYMQARLSPMSLTYYGFCLGNGNYTVNLHFAEIMFTNDKTYSSLGKRFFDVYIQGKLKLKDFNIEDEAGGVGKAIVKKFTIPVTDKTLEIRLYWAGKGTNAIPSLGVYGPLISAISVSSDFTPPSTHGRSNSTISIGMIAGIIVAAAAAAASIFLVVAILWWKGCCLRKKSTLEQDMKRLNLQTGSFSLKQIKAATKNFDVTNKIGEGGFGTVYKGILPDGTKIAVKKLSSISKQGNREFVNEIGMISGLRHSNLVKLYGCCIEGNQLMLIYEYLEKNCLARALFGPKEFQLKLDWPTRYNICVGIAKGLAYLHEESSLKIVHRDIKATNVLLDKHLNAKISDFGLAKLDEEDNTHISTRIAGTFGYMAPEYAMRGYLTDKADVYSFGIVALEIVSGRNKSSSLSEEESFYILDWAYVLKEQGKLMDLVDPRLGSNFNQEQAMSMINMALLCTTISAVARPLMSSVVSMLEGRITDQELASSSYNNSVRRKTQHQPTDETDLFQTPSWMSESETRSLTTVGLSV